MWATIVGWLTSAMSLLGVGVLVTAVQQYRRYREAAAALIARLAPDFLIVTGVCFGLREDAQTLGDVIVCRQLRAIDHRKVMEQESAGEPPVVLFRGDFVSSSVTLYDRFLAARSTWTDANVHYGTVLSSSVRGGALDEPVVPAAER